MHGPSALAERKGFSARAAACLRSALALALARAPRGGGTPHCGVPSSTLRIPLIICKAEGPCDAWAFRFGGEKGIRTLDTVPRIHDFQSCALDQLSHLSGSASYLTPFPCILQDVPGHFAGHSLPRAAFGALSRLQRRGRAVPRPGCGASPAPAGTRQRLRGGAADVPVRAAGPQGPAPETAATVNGAAKAAPFTAKLSSQAGERKQAVRRTFPPARQAPSSPAPETAATVNGAAKAAPFR